MRVPLTYKLFVLLTIMLVQNLHAQMKSDLEEMGIDINTVSLSTTIYDAYRENGKINMGEKIKYGCCDYYEFNQEGDITKHIEYRKDSSISRYNNYRHNYENGRKVKTKEGDNKYFKYTYKGGIVEENEYLQTKETGRLNLRYKRLYYIDKQGNLSRMEKYYNGESFSGMKVYKYDPKGNRIEMKRYNSDTTKTSHHWIYEYNEHGDVIEEYDPEYADGPYMLRRFYEYRYDETGNWTTKVKYSIKNRNGNTVKRPENVTLRKIVYNNKGLTKFFFDEGWDYFDRGDYQMAIESFTKSIKWGPDFPETYNSLGSVYMDMKNYEAALQNFKKASEISPEDGLYHFNIGIVKTLQGENEAGCEKFQEALDLGYEKAKVYVDEYCQ